MPSGLPACVEGGKATKETHGPQLGNGGGSNISKTAPSFDLRLEANNSGIEATVRTAIRNDGSGRMRFRLSSGMGRKPQRFAFFYPPPNVNSGDKLYATWKGTGSGLVCRVGEDGMSVKQLFSSRSTPRAANILKSQSFTSFKKFAKRQ